ncbi:putative Outer membrane efflux protein [Candidatus Nitrospira nitrosa]|uniref:Putative Outer membrane efflux protein n=1 Tax=Candidatus Nitrospira nitrosa TaxID=1742972 RepID=A0A0S4L7T8_9BACT|nr:TolC family protein [Candidatus Nitrospira nitrosa]CUS32862.1 putative Outer membrane efflux protein [Candidatus Nitrospira nitrosa]
MALILGAEPSGLRERAFGVLLTVMLFCVMSPGHVAAEEQEAVAPELKLSLRDAIQAAVDNNVNVRLLKERIAAAQAQTNTSFGALLPNVGGYLNGRHQTVNLAAFGLPADRLSGLGLTRSVTDPFEVYDARATLVQNIFSLSLLQRWRAAKSGLDVAGLEAEVTKRDVMATVGLLYIEVLRADEAVKARLTDIELSQQLLKLARDRRTAGVATGLDVTRQEVQLENNKQRLLVSQNEQESARLNLIRALGIAFDVRLTLTDELKFVPPVTQRVEEALVIAREQRLELRAQETRQRLATLSLSSVTSERIPSLSLNGDYGWIGLKPDEAVTTRSIGLTLSIPIFDGGQREGRISENRSRVRQESIRMKDVSDQVTLEVRNALLTLESSTQQVAVAEKGLELALKELTFAKDRFAAGLVTNIEVTNAQASVARARDNQIEALFRFNASRINLARAKGEIDKLF